MAYVTTNPAVPNSNRPAISEVIAKTATKNKFFEIHDALVPAKEEHYAMLHGIGGAHYAPVSGLRLTITDNSVKANNNGVSVYVKATVPRHVISQIFDVCRNNVGEKHDMGITSALSSIMQRQQMIVQTATTAILQGIETCKNSVLGTGHPKGPVGDFGSVLKAAKQALTQPVPPMPIAEKSFVNFSYHQDRVNVYKINDHGKAFVSVVDIKRNEFGTNGAKMRSPWMIKIANFYAPYQTHENGTMSFVNKESEFEDKQEAYILISDDDMYRMCYTTEHFISVWENAFCLPNIIAAKEKKAYAAQQNYKQSNRAG